jgi:mono/diheme cytochrome c family protein
MRGRFLMLGLAGLAATGAIGAALAQAPAPSSGVYTAAQASAGATLYAARCAMCHGPRLEGTFEIPALKGKFVANWAGAPIGDLFDYVSNAMPQSAPGSLSPDDNAKIVAFLLQQNGLPPGQTALPADSTKLRTIPFLPAQRAP